MNTSYSRLFDPYITQLSLRQPAPGGGSAIALVYCIALAIIQKAGIYSATQSPKLLPAVKKLETMRAKILPHIDLDAFYFAEAMKSSGKQRLRFLGQADTITRRTACACVQALHLCGAMRTHIKKSIWADFAIGHNLLTVVLEGCIANLTGNETLSKRSNAFLTRIRKERGVVCKKL